MACPYEDFFTASEPFREPGDAPAITAMEQ